MHTNERLACEAGSLRMFQDSFESSKVLREKPAYPPNAATSKLTILITGGTGSPMPSSCYPPARKHNYAGAD